MYICGHDVTSVMLNSTFCSFIMKTPQNFVKGSLPIKSTKNCQELGVTFWPQVPFKFFFKNIKFGKRYSIVPNVPHIHECLLLGVKSYTKTNVNASQSYSISFFSKRILQKIVEPKKRSDSYRNTFTQTGQNRYSSFALYSVFNNGPKRFIFCEDNYSFNKFIKITNVHPRKGIFLNN